MENFPLILILAIIRVDVIMVGAQAAYKVDLKGAVKNKALHGYTFLNLTQTPIIDCFENCVKNCLCMAFQICQNTECQLLSSSRFLSSSSLYPNQGCIYYDLSLRKSFQENDGQDAGNCRAVFNCCKTSNPCHNGGICLISSTSTTKRYRCKCPKGYTGQHCENPIKSCRGYGSGKHVAGSYTVIDAKNNPFDVFCDFDGSSNMTWTLIQSYSLENINIFKNLALYIDSPQNQNNPSWLQYRLSKSQMQFIQQDSSKWRFTCAYETDNVSYTDYVRGLNSKVDILTFDGHGICVDLEYINIRGQNCSSCTAAMWQGQDAMVHFDSFHGNNKNCDFKPTASIPCLGKGEDNFGFYSCKNPKHRCSSSTQATTQTWFGGED